MQFFEEHFTRHHLKRAPHRWFVALVLSPIHHAEMRYKRQYHLRFAHAKKLFLFDMILLLSTVFLLASSLFWSMYDPTVTELVHLDVVASTETYRLRSGDDVTLAIEVHNQSDVTLTTPVLTIGAPIGFVFSEASMAYTKKNNGMIRFDLEKLTPGEMETLQLNGQYYGPVDAHESIQTMLIYTQEGRQTPESDVHRLFLTAREPSATVQAKVPQYLVPGVDTPITIELTNEHDHALPPLSLQVGTNNVIWSGGAPSIGTFDAAPGVWNIPELQPRASASLVGTMQVRPDAAAQTQPWTIDTSLSILDTQVLEQTSSVDLNIARPSLRIDNSWEEPYVAFGNTEATNIQITNNGNVPLQELFITHDGRGISVDAGTVQPGQTSSLALPLAILQTSIEQDTNGPLFVPRLDVTATIPGVTGYTYTQRATLKPVLVASTLTLGQSARYYTAEGDQLGRGPLPPTVGKETKYWVFTQIQNTVGDLRDVSFSTTLAPGTRWTGKSSVSRGNDITYDTSSRTATWKSSRMNPYESVGIYFEIAVTPGSHDIGTIPSLIAGSSASAHDLHVDTLISASGGPINAALFGDPIGQEKGTVVQ